MRVISRSFRLKFSTVNKRERGPPTFDINSRAVLGAFHSGLGRHSQYSGLLATLGLPSLTAQNYKHWERESGKTVEVVSKRCCEIYTEVEKNESKSQTCDDEIVKIGVSYDMGWRKRGRTYDSSSGMGSAIGVKTGKVLSYATRTE